MRTLLRASRLWSGNARRRDHAHAPQGFTLAEALIAATILAIVSVTATLPFISGLQHVNEALRREYAVFLGEAMMEEVLARPFFPSGSRTPTPGPEAGEQRDTFDSIDDFHGYAETAGDLRNYKNQPFKIESFPDFWRKVTVEYISFPNQSPGDTNCFMRVTVQVFDASEMLVQLTRIASRED